VATTHIEHALGHVLPGRRGQRPPPARSADVESRLEARRLRVMSLRRQFVLGDVVVTLCVLGLTLATGHDVAAGMALAVALAVTAHVWAADSPRSMVAFRPVVRPAVVLSGVGCVLVSLLGTGSAGREVVLGAGSVSIGLVVVRTVVRLPALAGRFGLGHRRRLIVGDPQALETAAARRAPAVEAGEVILVITRAERPSATASGDQQAISARKDGEDQRRMRDERSGPAGVVERVVRTALDSNAERVSVIPGDGWQQRQLRELSWLLEGTGIDMVISTNLDGIAPHRVDVVQQEGRLMIKVGSASPSGTQALVKGVVDRLAAAVLLVVSAPVLLAICAAVRLESKGPAIFRQTRVRERGGTFTMYKFRSMCVGAEQQLTELQQMNVHGSEQTLFKMENDPRITRVGHLLRKTSLDELPQLVNVLLGQMSLIGPRPALPHEVELYDYAARRRLAVKPGMTGLWQVSGRSRLTWDESIGYDLDYVDNWSPGADAAIAVRTFRAVVTKDGAL
jgi:exopolysaccharide biosynthesis polyprenyl glycosylphosphotransferase